jgi:hypothetical protein
MNLKPFVLTLLALPALPACAADSAESSDPPGENVQSTKQAIEDGELALPWQIARAVRVSSSLGGCSGTRIAPDYVITAAHCGVAAGNTVRFFSAGSAFPQSSDTARSVDKVGKRPGTSTSDWEDENGIFSDIAILKLDGPTVTTGTFAKLAWLYPGDDAFGEKVGNGAHEDISSNFGILRRKYDTTWTSSDADGPFRTSEDAVNVGDSGGAFYYQSKLLGVLSSHDLFSGVWRARYTSVARHLHWILDVINYEWPGMPPVNGRWLQGAASTSFFGKSHLVCQYACDNTSTCAGYNYLSTLDQCNLLSTVTSAINGIAGAASGIR